MKKWLCFVLAVLLAYTAGCSNQRGEASLSDGEQVKELTMMLPQTHYKDFLKQLLQEFAQENERIRIVPQIIPDNQWIDVVKVKTAVSETPDLIRIDRGLLEEVGAEHFVRFDESEPWYDRVRPEQLKNKMIGGKLYGLPVSSSTSLGMVYNRRMFEEYSIEIPQNFQELVEVCKTLKKKGVIPIYASDKDSWTVQIGFNCIASQVTSEETWQKIKTNRQKWSAVPQFVEILEDMASLRQNGYTNSDYKEATYTSAQTAMAEEKAAMYIAGQFFISDVQAQNPDIDLIVFPMPYEKDILTMIDGPGQISLFQDSPHIEEAKVFLNWFSQPEHMDVFTDGWGHTPVFKDQKQPVSECQRELTEKYISRGKTVLEVDNIFVGVDLNDFWNYQQEMYAGVLSAEEALKKWDESFARQMREKEEAGWGS